LLKEIKMTSIILDEICRLFGPDFKTDPIFQEAFDQNANQRLAEIGDCVLNLIVKEKEYRCSDSTSQSINDAQQRYATKNRNQRILNSDLDFTEFLVAKGCTSPVGHIGLDRADAFMEAIIGALFLERNYDTAKKFTIKILELQ